MQIGGYTRHLFFKDNVMGQTLTAAYQAERNGVVYDYEHRSEQLSMRGSDGTYSSWDMEHYRKVKVAREKLGLCKVSGSEVEHPLKGKTLVNNGTGKSYVVEKVIRNWWFGAFLTAIVNGGKDSHAVFHIENIDCVIPATINQVREFQANFRVAD
jgi:hypothetical protein